MLMTWGQHQKFFKVDKPNTNNVRKVETKTALISVYDKRDIVNFARCLGDAGYKIISTSGTAKLLAGNEVCAEEISEITKFPEILDGRVKTLHPAIFGGLLADKNNEAHISEIKKHNILPIDLVVVNLYPFKNVINRKHTINEAIENIDIGGVSLIRAGAKNYKNVAVVVDPQDYNTIADEIKNNPDKEISLPTREKLCAKAFAYVSYYDIVIHDYFSEKFENGFGNKFFISGEKFYDMRYGENPHQNAAVYKTDNIAKNFILDSVIYEGKKLSFNNIPDLNLALKVVAEFKESACCVIKHAIPCGAAIGENSDEAYDLAYECDPKSAFGGIFGFNGKVTEYVANELSKFFFECIIAKDYEDEAVNILKKKKNLRILKKDVSELSLEEYNIRKFSGGFMIQDEDKKHLTLDELKNLPVVTNKKPTDEEYKAMFFADKIVKHVRSNAIVLAKSNKTSSFTVGIGSGQTSRVDAVKISITKANQSNESKSINSVLASDAFFPFRDGIDEAANGGISAVIQPGGSIRDKETIDACNEHNIAMVFTNIRHFLH
ncbi:Bifunctional purine biosynthesis protein PurH (Includes: Phosphoribosylaminoimidazolecarboxamide formyltransferase; IMP cyclohydrolase) [groundwater metagenome]|uniref:Bifunctional purine biosynthesis protein PurH n=1 Tax=groundwater metagenome TaxID=717931 RepID=A0A098E9Q7_9ZZZZ